LRVDKGLVHPKIKHMPSFTCPDVIPNYISHYISSLMKSYNNFM